MDTICFFAGDFGHLPPLVGGEKVSLYSHIIGISGRTKREQEEALGKALWHQEQLYIKKDMQQKSSLNMTTDCAQP